LTSQRSIRVGSELGRLGFRLGRSRPGRARHVARCDAAMSQSWALIGLRPQCGSHRVAHGGPTLMVHGLTAGRMVDQVHRLFSLARLMCTELIYGWPARGCSPVFLPRWCYCRRRADCESSWRCWCPIGEGKRLPQATATAMVGSRWRPGLTKALATVNGGSAVLAGGEVAFAGSPVARLGR